MFPWRWHRRHWQRRRRNLPLPITGSLIVIALCILTGCRKRNDFERRRAEIRQELQQGYLDAALPAAERAYNDSQSDPLWHWRFRVLKAETLVRRAAYKDALALLQPEPPKEFPSDVLVGRRNLQGVAYCLSDSDYGAGETSLKEAKRLAGSDRALLAEVALSMGRCAGQQHDSKRAEDEFRQAEDLAQNVAPFIQASAAGNLALMLLKDERYGQAIDKFQQVMSLAHAMQSPVLEERTIGNLGYSYSELGDEKKALALFEQTLKMAQGLKDRRDQITTLINLGLAHSGVWELDEAERNYLQALDFAKQLHDDNNAILALNNLVVIELRRKNINRAEQYWKEAMAVLPAGSPAFPVRQNTMESTPALRRFQLALDEAEIAIARQQHTLAEQLLSRILRGFKLDAARQSLTENDLATVYWHENKPLTAERMFLQAIHSAENGFASLKKDEYRLSFLDRRGFYDIYIQFLVAQHRPTEALRIAERNRAQAIVQRTRETSQGELPFSISRMQRSLNHSKKIALTYTVTDDQTFLWVISAKQYRVFTLPGGPELYKHIVRYNEEIQQRHNAEDSLEAKTLYEKLVLPAAKLIPKGSRVIIVPSRAVALANFEALVVPLPQPHYWLEDVEVEYAGSLAGIINRQEGPATGKAFQDLLVIGAPVEANKEFPALQHAPEEIKYVQSHFDASREKVVTGAQAIPAAYRVSDPAKYRYIHFDTHGINSDLSPLDSAIVLSAGPDKEYKLYGREIKDIPIHADLVTISACYGAGTRVYNAEGTIGLGWAFLRAGAHQVIAATWEIDDELTAKFMDDFYGALSQGKPAVDALHDAKLHMLHSTTFERHPYYWASLQLYTGY